ncbi:type II toxin-antitoxin system prevent-host-death family antitoxin [Rathayibacter sp. YIM 133350]|uniref:type II toxin-antitoxin system Phd/YefM family antitoxin n=1 Tax=Rathayibacter sp. YIM 133350 TaxID=3131992 RepID=UPI00307DADFB
MAESSDDAAEATESVGIRSLKQNASAVVARAEAGANLTITDRGRPVARLSPIGRSRLAELETAGRLRAPLRDLTELPPAATGSPLSAVLAQMRDEEDV